MTGETAASEDFDAEYDDDLMEIPYPVGFSRLRHLNDHCQN
ncbi:MAG: hypothetical protein PUE94_04250 [Lachnospiraceae bacterium]|nr:hypothetical protein [Lachnospiraceae bacterium]